MIYLEISARQCGKTTRLLQFAVDRAMEGSRVCIVCGMYFEKTNLSAKIKNVILDAILKRSKDLEVNSIQNYSLCITICAFKAPIGLEYDWYLYDEFDFNSCLGIEDVRENSYFVTSPKFLRKVDQISNTDLLGYLLKVKNNEYLCYAREEKKYSSSHMWLGEYTGCWCVDEKYVPIIPKRIYVNW